MESDTIEIIAETSEDSEMEARTEREVHRMRKDYTLLIFLCAVTFGLLQIIPVAVSDIAELAASTTRDVSLGFPIHAVAYCIGALSFSWLMDRIGRPLCLVAALILSAILTLSIPLFGYIQWYWLAQAILGIMSPGFELASNSWIVGMWQESADRYKQVLLLGMSIGIASVSAIIKPFLSHTEFHDMGTDGNFTTTTTLYHGDQIWIPFSLVACSAAAVAVIILIIYRKQPETALFSDPFPQGHPTTTARTGNERGNSIVDVTLGCLLMGFFAGSEYNTVTLIPTFAVFCPLHLFKSTSAFMYSAMTAASGVSLLLSMWIAQRVSPRNMLFAAMTIVTAGNVLLWFASQDDPEVLMWIALCIMGCGNATVIPSIYSYLALEMEMTYTVFVWFAFSKSLFRASASFITSVYIVTQPLCLIHVNLVCLVVAIFLLSVIACKNACMKKPIRSNKS